MTVLPRCRKCGRDIGYTRADGWYHLHNEHRHCTMGTRARDTEGPLQWSKPDGSTPATPPPS